MGDQETSQQIRDREAHSAHPIRGQPGYQVPLGALLLTTDPEVLKAMRERHRKQPPFGAFPWENGPSTPGSLSTKAEVGAEPAIEADIVCGLHGHCYCGEATYNLKPHKVCCVCGHRTVNLAAATLSRSMAREREMEHRWPGISRLID